METKKYYVVIEEILYEVDRDTYQRWKKNSTIDGVIAIENIGDKKVITTFHGEDSPVFLTEANNGSTSITYDFKSAMAAHEKVCADLKS